MHFNYHFKTTNFFWHFKTAKTTTTFGEDEQNCTADLAANISKGDDDEGEGEEEEDGEPMDMEV